MTNLQKIINYLDTNPTIKLNKLETLLEKYNNNDWKHYVQFNKTTYQKNLVFRNKNYEIFIVCWDKYQKSRVHDHSKNGCILKILDGQLTEYKYNPKTLKLEEINNLPINQISYIDNTTGYHKIMNDNKFKTISLHIYSPPKYKANIYNIDD
jgi:cysteine dioxygenase